jgi:hypothetical protein
MLTLSFLSELLAIYLLLTPLSVGGQDLAIPGASTVTDVTERTRLAFTKSVRRSRFDSPAVRC